MNLNEKRIEIIGSYVISHNTLIADLDSIGHNLKCNTYGFSPVCILMCLSICDGFKNVLPHTLHDLLGLLPSASLVSVVSSDSTSSLELDGMVEETLVLLSGTIFDLILYDTCGLD